MCGIVPGIDCAAKLFIGKDTDGYCALCKAVSAVARAPSLIPYPVALPDPAGRSHKDEQGVQTV